MTMNSSATNLETGNDETTPAPAGHNVWRAIQKRFNVINHLMNTAVAFYMTYFCYGAGNAPVSWHAWLCTIGYQLLMSEAILSLYSENVWSMQCSRKTKKNIHWILQAVGSTIAFAGIITEYIFRSLKSKPHFSTTHSTIGLIAAVFTLIGIVNGVSALWAFELRKFVRPVYSKLLHNLHGIVAFVLGMTAQFIGYDKHFMTHTARNETRIILQTLAVITVLLSLIGAIRAAIKHIRTTVK